MTITQVSDVERALRAEIARLTAALAEQPAQQEACPTCGEYEPRTGTCGTSPNDKRALCNRNAPQPAQQEPVANIPGLAADESAFVRWALKNKYDASSHPMFFVMLDPKTYEARMGWKAAVAHYKAQRKPLTDPEIYKAINDWIGDIDPEDEPSALDIFRAAEAAHGITEDKHRLTKDAR